MTSFTVVVPFRNRAKFLQRALNSIAAQTLLPSQLVLVDNGSTDESVAICQAFMETHEHDRNLEIALLSEPHPGATLARNRGLQFAKGEWIYFFDSDDEMSPQFLSDAFEALCKTPCDVVAAATCLVFEDGKSVPRKVYHTAAVADQILTGMLATQGMVIRTDFLRKIGGWNPTLPIWNDWELGVRLLMAKPRLIWLKEKAYHRIHQHAESITGTSFAARFEGLKMALSAVEADISTSSARQDHVALQARIAILSGKLQREGQVGKSRELQSLLPSSPFIMRVFHTLLQRLTALGVPGGWWIARKAINTLIKQKK